ncbi:gamma-glutamylcyclotransferase [Methylobacterium sp. Leaf118]|uniref:gamma-glutamylcyclotransferase n=1 Tax=Methylobacterium sp. Leaf118 TaxID=2876562 RepID=UPI001E4D7659|nr:gamma-glutamylcyclotransferase [Methylobacterium sp. Leaf118]
MASRTLTLSLDLIARAHPDPVADDPDALALLSDAEMAPDLAAMLARRLSPEGGLWVFAYGSLLWSPEFSYHESRVGTVRGWHRRFCLRQHRFRGTLAQPGLVLALERGGLCRGVAFRLDEADPHATLMPVWRREMKGKGYEARWVAVATDAGPLRALTFVANRRSERYTGRLSDADLADTIAAAAGHLGPSAEYLFRTVEACAELGLHDRHLWRLQALVAERLERRAANDPPR